MTCRDTEEDEPMTDSATDQAPLDVPVPPERNPMRDPGNRLKLAVFCANVARGTSMSEAETLPKVTWEESQRLAQAADRAGIDAMIPLGRWKATARGAAEVDRTFEPWVWASALSALTERISVFTTVNMQQYHPLVAALMTSTIDHVSGGRFSLNVVAGFNEQEFRMLGLEVPSHEDRYAHAAEWMTIIRRAWTEAEPFDVDGDYLTVEEVVSQPKPLQQPAPPIMSAGTSELGRRFAASHADINFVHLPSLEEMPPIVAAAKAEAREHAGRDVEIYSSAYIVVADTEEEAWRRYHHVTRERLDRKAAAGLIEMWERLSKGGEVIDVEQRIDRMAAGFNAMPFVGTAEQVAELLVRAADGGLDGLAISWDDYDEGLATYAEAVRPLLLQAGLRKD
jgi:alkanesulfonate monooxygenase SsuD/methylene tetrahydromethanopterin reductase-like flavin-dependent oxidoreductase (luciferase family)